MHLNITQYSIKAEEHIIKLSTAFYCIVGEIINVITEKITIIILDSISCINKDGNVCHGPYSHQK